jgi:filamentous hemagglutinin
LAVTNSSKDIFTWTSAGDIALRTGGRAVISSGISTAIQGGSFGDNFNAALLGEAGNVAMATGFNWVGDYVTFPNGSPQKIIAHALMGGLLAEATGSDFKTGAAAAGLNEALINQLTWAAQGNKDITLMLSQLTGLLAAAAVDGDLEKGSQIAQKATTFNYLYHKEVEEMLREVDSKSTEQEKRAVRERYAALDQQRNDELDALCARDPQRCRGIAISLANDDQKLVDLVGKLRSQGQGGAASAVGFVIGSNLDASSKIAADISSAGGGVLVKLGAEAIKAGVGVTLPSRSGAGKGKGSQGEAVGPDVPQGAKATVQGPLVSKGSDVTPEIIQKALQGDPAISGQNFVSLPAVQRYVDRLLKGDVAPPIKMDGNIIVDGNHRYIAAKILGRSPEVAPGTLSPSKAGQTKPVSDVKIDPVDWGNR